MPRSLVPETFGPEYAEMLRLAQKQDGLILPFHSNRDAHLFRLRIYSYFRALRADGKAKDLIALANYFSVQFDAGPPVCLRLIPTQSLPDRQYLRAQLGLTPLGKPDEPATVGTLSSRLKELRGKRLK